MKVEEFSNEYDTLLNSFSNSESIALDEYEKSVYLTQAQEQIVIELYTGKYSGDGFERTEEVRRYLSNLVKTFQTSQKLVGHLGLSKTSMFYQLPSDVWFITYESAILKDEKLQCSSETEVLIVPTTQDEYYKISKNPFRKPTKNRALRLDVEGSIVELISEYDIDKYLIRYLTKPTPIILTDLDQVSINGISVKTECQLDNALHRVILERAVRLTLISKSLYTDKDK